MKDQHRAPQQATVGRAYGTNARTLVHHDQEDILYDPHAMGLF